MMRKDVADQASAGRKRPTSSQDRHVLQPQPEQLRSRRRPNTSAGKLIIQKGGAHDNQREGLLGDKCVGSYAGGGGVGAARHLAGRERCSGMLKSIRRLRVEEPEPIVVEATGKCETRVVREISAAGLAVALVGPQRVRQYARARGQLAKTVRLDAQNLAEFGKQVRLTKQEGRF
jgi:transposase